MQIAGIAGPSYCRRAVKASLKRQQAEAAAQRPRASLFRRLTGGCFSASSGDGPLRLRWVHACFGWLAGLAHLGQHAQGSFLSHFRSFLACFCLPGHAQLGTLTSRLAHQHCSCTHPLAARRKDLERQRLQLLCLGRLPYSPDDPLHFELWQAVCWGFTGGQAVSAAAAATSPYSGCVWLLYGPTQAAPAPTRSQPRHPARAAGTGAIEEHPSEMVHGAPAWQLLGFRAANPASSLGGAGMLPLLMLLLALDYASHLAARLLHAALAGALLPPHQQRAAPRLPPFSLADAAVEITRWTLRLLADGSLNTQAQRLGSATIAAGRLGGGWRVVAAAEVCCTSACPRVLSHANPLPCLLLIPHLHAPPCPQSCSGLARWTPLPRAGRLPLPAGQRPAGRRAGTPSRSACCCRCWCRRSRRPALTCAQQSSASCGGRRGRRRRRRAAAAAPSYVLYSVSLPPFYRSCFTVVLHCALPIGCSCAGGRGCRRLGTAAPPPSSGCVMECHRMSATQQGRRASPRGRVS